MPAPDSLVSVVIPLYNSEQWIEETLATVQRQTVDPESLEIIVVDNGSTDHGPEIVRRHAPQCTLISLGDNRGPSIARNIGWRRSRSPWIQFLDSDDLLAPEKLTHQLASAAAVPADVAVIYSEWQAYSLEGEWKPTPPVWAPALDGDLVQNLLRPENFIATGSQLFRTAWLDKIGGFDEQHWIIEDVHLLLRIAMAGGQFLSAPAGRALFYYRKRGTSSLSGSRHLEFLIASVRNLRLAEDYWTAGKLLTEQRLHFLVDWYEPLLHSLAELDPPEFERLLAHILSLSPDWLPKHRRMRILSKMFGYRAAERISARYRALKTKVAGHP